MHALNINSGSNDMPDCAHIQVRFHTQEATMFGYTLCGTVVIIKFMAVESSHGGRAGPKRITIMLMYDIADGDGNCDDMRTITILITIKMLMCSYFGDFCWQLIVLLLLVAVSLQLLLLMTVSLQLLYYQFH